MATDKGGTERTRALQARALAHGIKMLDAALFADNAEAVWADDTPLHTYVHGVVHEGACYVHYSVADNGRTRFILTAMPMRDGGLNVDVITSAIMSQREAIEDVVLNDAIVAAAIAALEATLADIYATLTA